MGEGEREGALALSLFFFFFTLRHLRIADLQPGQRRIFIRYIQALPGRESGKTTEIYTHITHKGMDRIKSPLGDLEF